MGNLLVNGELAGDLKTIQSDKVFLGKGGAEFFFQNIAVVGTDNKGEKGAGVAKNGLLDLGVNLGHVLVGKGKVEAVFAGLGKDFNKGTGSKVLKLVNIKVKVAAFFFGNVNAVHGGLLETGNDHRAQQSGVVFAEFALGEVDQKNFVGFHDFFQGNAGVGLADDGADQGRGNELTDLVLNRRDGFFLKTIGHFFKFLLPEVDKNRVLESGDDFLAELLVA